MRVELPIADIVRCSRDAQFLDAVAALYERLDAVIAAKNPVCTNRGDCCKFDTFGHNLFVTSVELAHFLGGVSAAIDAPPDRSHCPYQREGRCSVRTFRPAGCRVFFCEPRSQDWQGGLTEQAIAELAALGERFVLPYAYVEWTDALRALAAIPSGEGDSEGLGKII